MARSVYGSLLFLVALASLIGVAQAQTPPPGVVVRAVGTTASGFTSAGEMMASATYEGRLAAQSGSVAQGLFYQRAVTFAKPTVANAARTRMAYAVGGAVALSAAILATGYILDQITMDITTPGETPGGFVGFFYYSSECATYFPHTNCHGRQSYTIQGACGTGGPATLQGEHWYCASGYIVDGGAFTYDPSSNCNASTNCVFTPAAPGVRVTDDQLVDVIKANPATWPEILTSPTGTPYVWPPMPQQMQEVQTQYRKDVGLAPLPAGTPEPLPAPTQTPYVNPGSSVAPAPVEEPGTSTNPTPTGGVTVAFPGFCSWAEKLCQFVDWVKEPPPEDAEPQMPEREISGEEWDAGLGDGACPVPAQVTISGKVSEATYQPLCDLATGIKPFLLIVAALAAAVIIAG